MGFLRVLVVLVSVLGCSHCSFVDTLTKCSLADNECHSKLIQKMIFVIGEYGVPEHGLSAFDPMKLKNMKVNVQDVIDLNMVEGTATGMKNCIVDKSELNIKQLRSSITITCDFVITGHYTAKSTGRFIEDLFKMPLHGDGNATIKINKITITLTFRLQIEKRGDLTFITNDPKKFEYTYKVKGDVNFHADNIYIGEKESSKEVCKMMNENWKFILDTFGKQFFDVSMKIVVKSTNDFFNIVPANYYIADNDIKTLN